ncbi:MAG: sulfate/molybdate ABC transporter ATP-binding protein [Planctomycetia bacterium]
MSITVRNVTKRFGDFAALDDVTIDVPNGSLLALLGPSGSGKTTLLRIIAGLEAPDSGEVRYHEEDMTHRSPRERNAGFVFQHYALFRHMTVFDNVAFGLRVRGKPTADVKTRVDELLQLVGLGALGGRYPAQLSGGQRQRVALARALAIEPQVLLLDEPFGALDAKVRTELRRELRKLHDETHVTSVFVTHDQEEAFEVADVVVLMNHGKVEQIGSPLDVFEKPSNSFVMDFLGNVNVLAAQVRNGVARVGSVELSVPEYMHDVSRPANLYVRPHELTIDRRSNGVGSLKARLEHVNPVGSIARLRLTAFDTGAPLQVDCSQQRFAELELRIGDDVYVSPDRVRVFWPEDYSI